MNSNHMKEDKLVQSIVELYRRAATCLPDDVCKSLEKVRNEEESGTAARCAMDVVVENFRLAREKSLPICQDTGTPIFYVRLGGEDIRTVRKAIIEGTARATAEIPLRPNAVAAPMGKNTGNNIGIGLPVIYFEDDHGVDGLQIDLMLKGGGSENIGEIYKLPDKKLGGRDLKGIRNCVIDAVFKAQGKGCPPEIVAVGIGSPKDALASFTKKQLLRRLDDTNPDPDLDRLEKSLVTDLNSLGIGPAGLGGRNLVIGVKIGGMHRHPASYFVEVAFACWACRRAHMKVTGCEVSYE